MAVIKAISVPFDNNINFVCEHTHVYRQCKMHSIIMKNSYPVTMISCGNITLTDFEVVVKWLQSNSTTDEAEESTTIYHCAESISMSQTVSIVCSSDGVSRWNTDPDSHGCVFNNYTRELEGPEGKPGLEI